MGDRNGIRQPTQYLLETHSCGKPIRVSTDGLITKWD